MSMSSSPSSTDGIVIEQLFHTKRIDDFVTRIFTILYTPIGLLILILRIFIGIHAFLIACLLRKSRAIRSVVLRLMCGVLGVIITEKGKRDNSTRVLCSNHSSILDHLAIDLISPCLLPSVWDIPSIIRWCFGYVDLGASRGRSELVENAKKMISTSQLPLLAFPEGVITSGQTALLKFNSWSLEISDSVQPIAIKIWRPMPWRVAPSIIGSTWWTDLVYFFGLPFTLINVNYLPKVERNQNESVEQFSDRVANVIAKELGIIVSKFETRDAAEAEKRWKKDRETRKQNQSKEKTNRLVDPRQLDECAMRIKQSYPTFHLSIIRNDLEKTRNQATTVNNLKNGKLPNEYEINGKISLDASSWKKTFDDRKWQMIEVNRSKYLQRDS